MSDSVRPAMREGWRRVDLRKILSREQEWVDVEDGVTYPSLGVARDGQGLFEKEPFVGGATSYSRLARVREGQLVLRTITAWEAPIGVVRDIHSGFHVSPSVFPVFSVTEDECLPPYLALVCQLPSFWREMQLRTTGTVLRRQTLSADALLTIPIDLPPLPEQRRIVDLIGAVDAQIEAAERLSSAIDELRRAAGNHYWTHHPERTTLRQLGALVTGATPSTKRAEYWDADDVPFVCPADFTRFMIADAERWVSIKGADAVRRLPRFSVLQVCIGATVGKVGVTDREVVTNQQINALVGLAFGDATYVGALMAAPAGQQALQPLIGQTTMPIVKKSAWGDFSIPWPDGSVRERASAAFEALHRSKRAVDEEVSAIRRVRRALLFDLLSGAHEIPSSYDRLLAA